MANINRLGFSVVSSGEKSRDGSECQPVVNIVFIHGLRGNPRKTWEKWETPVPTPSDEGTRAKKTHGIKSFFAKKTKHHEVPHPEASTASHGTEPRSRQKIFWIEDFLPEDIPNARILTYGYNADVIGGFFQSDNKNSMSQHGRDLAAKLERELNKNEAPIIFVAHSLGGIVAKDAICRSKSVRERTKMMAFLGTPHRGSTFADWGQIASNIARLALQDSNKKILETLEVNSEILNNIQERFITIASDDGLTVHSFQEAHGITGIKGLHNKVVPDFSSKVELPPAQETVETMDANHMEMTKFSKRDDAGYRDVSGVLEKWTNELLLKAQQVDSVEAPVPSFNTHPRSLTAVTPTAKVHFIVPPQTIGELIGREQYIQSLETKLCIRERHCRVALVGLGGIGKTRIALEYASKHKGSDSMSVFWVHASTAERMEKAYQEIAKKARLVEAENLKVDPLQLVKNWLESEDSGQWLMVIDNADDENLFFGEDENQGQEHSLSKKLARYFPRCSNGSILLTTRNRRLGFKFATVDGLIKIPEMSVSESKSLLAEKLGEDNYDENDLTELAEVLENLPLALIQAAAFIGGQSKPIGEYLQMYRESDSSRIQLLSQDFEDDERDPDSKNPVAVTWAISFEQIRKNDPRAAELLSLMSVLDRQAIPKSILSSDKEEVELEVALGTLKAYSLITVEQNRQTFNLHRLVYLATRNWLSMNEELDSWTGNALVLLSELFPFPRYENQETWMAYLPHAYTILNSDQLPASKSIAEANLLYNVSWAFQEKGNYDPAETMARKSSYLREKVRGEMDLDTLRSLNTLAIVLDKQGKYQEAETLHRQALSCYEKTGRKNHSDTLYSLNNLANVLNNQGKYEEAEELHLRALSVREEILGKEHPDTLHSISNLANVLNSRGKYKEAEGLNRQALSGREKILEIEHPDTLGNINNLAIVLQSQGRYEEAEELNRRALSGREKTLGKEHPDTLRSINNLANVLDTQEKHEEAEELHRRALSGREKILGKEHPYTLHSISNLASVLESQGRYEEAEDLDRRVLSGRESILGKEHPDTLHSIYNLANVLDNQEKYEEAEELHRQALRAREKILGNEHRKTLDSVWGLAYVFDRQCQYQSASQLYQRAHMGYKKLLGSDHPHTQSCAQNYRLMLERMNQESEAPTTDVVREN